MASIKCVYKTSSSAIVTLNQLTYGLREYEIERERENVRANTPTTTRKHTNNTEQSTNKTRTNKQRRNNRILNDCIYNLFLFFGSFRFIHFVVRCWNLVEHQNQCDDQQQIRSHVYLACRLSLHFILRFAREN